ncbi:MAG: peptide chain release factor N(5)-glutamine methyltransferase [Candidatus Dormibacteraeota bacterium]|nr:peptide chain release factor N(5)-glutamine methyltransferase [Candidatus Dormibacteraeota bacterium]
MAAAQRTLLDVVKLSTGYLQQHGSVSPRLDAELLAAHALGLRRIDLYLQHDRPLDERELAEIRELIRRRGAGEPVAYLTGEREFFGRSFIVTPAVLVPRPETETLVERALAVASACDGRPLRIADLGAGSGCIAVTLAAELPAAAVEATDVSDAALQVTLRNAQRHEVADRVAVRPGPWATPLTDVVDIVVSNPPYVTSEELAAVDAAVRDHEPRLALEAGDDGLGPYRDLVATLTGRIAPGGTLFLEVDPRRAAAVTALVTTTLAPQTTTTHRDLAGHERVVEARWP